MLVAQISDLHVRRPGRLHHMPDTARALTRALAVLAALDPRPDLVIATGDLTDEGKPSEYARLRGILDAAPIEVALLPGNHDDRKALRAAFSERRELGKDGPICYAIELDALRVVMLDSTKPGKGGGHLGQRRLEWLDATLAANDAPTILALHHPPYATRTPYLDQLGFKGARAFESVVARHAHVVRVTSGHIHRASTRAWGGTVATTAPSTATQLAMRPLGRISVPSVEPAGVLLHRWDGTTLTTSVVRLRDEREAIVAA